MINLNTLAYLILFVIFIYVSYIERTDIHCPKLTGSTEKECEEYGGMPYVGTKPKDTDSCKELIEKIYKGAGAEQASIKWRRSLLLAIGSTFLIFILLGSKLGNFNFLPDWRTMYLAVLIMFVTILMSFIYYSYHVFGIAENWMKMSIKELEQKGCINDK